MTIALPPALSQLVDRLINTGRYADEGEVVREALRSLHEKETRNRTKLASLRDAVQLGIAAADQDQLADWDEQVSKEVKEMGRRRRRG